MTLRTHNEPQVTSDKNTKNLKNTNATILERCYIDAKAKLRLEGSEKLTDDYKRHHGFDPCLSCSCNEFRCVFSEDEKFYYKLDHYLDSSVVASEIGIASLCEDDQGYYIDRLNIVTRISGEGEVIPTNKPYLTHVKDNIREYLQISTFTSGNVTELLIDPHTLVYTDIDGVRQPLYVNENSVVGREGLEVTSLDKSSLWNILCSFTKALHMKAYSLYVRMLNTKAVVFSPAKPSKRTLKGSIILDDDKGLCFYDGKHWHTIVMERIHDGETQT